MKSKRPNLNVPIRLLFCMLRCLSVFACSNVSFTLISSLIYNSSSIRLNLMNMDCSCAILLSVHSLITHSKTINETSENLKERETEYFRFEMKIRCRDLALETYTQHDMWQFASDKTNQRNKQTNHSLSWHEYLSSLQYHWLRFGEMASVCESIDSTYNASGRVCMYPCPSNTLLCQARNGPNSFFLVFFFCCCMLDTWRRNATAEPKFKVWGAFVQIVLYEMCQNAVHHPFSLFHKYTWNVCQCNTLVSPSLRVRMSRVI